MKVFENQEHGQKCVNLQTDVFLKTGEINIRTSDSGKQKALKYSGKRYRSRSHDLVSNPVSAELNIQVT